MQLFLISGISGCGKTVFGDWLRDHRGFTHIDMESFDGTPAHKIWDNAYSQNKLSLFVDHFRSETDKLVLTWGFRPSQLNIVRAMQKAGIECWWFDAPEMIARDSFLNRNTVNEAAFNVQIDAIRATQKLFLEFYQNRICVVMFGKRLYRDQADICRQMNIV